MIDIQTGSGLIKRCPECKRALVKGACAEHGKVKGEYDLRINRITSYNVCYTKLLRCGNTLGPWLAATMLRRQGMQTDLGRRRDFGLYLLLGVLVGMAINRNNFV